MNLASPELAVTLVVPDKPVLASAFDATTALEESGPVVTTFWSSSFRTTTTSELKSKAFLALDGPETTTSKAAPWVRFTRCPTTKSPELKVRSYWPTFP